MFLVIHARARCTANRSRHHLRTRETSDPPRTRARDGKLGGGGIIVTCKTFPTRRATKPPAEREEERFNVQRSVDLDVPPRRPVVTRHEDVVLDRPVRGTGLGPASLTNHLHAPSV